MPRRPACLPAPWGGGVGKSGGARRIRCKSKSWSNYHSITCCPRHQKKGNTWLVICSCRWWWWQRWLHDRIDCTTSMLLSARLATFIWCVRLLPSVPLTPH